VQNTPNDDCQEEISYVYYLLSLAVHVRCEMVCTRQEPLPQSTVSTVDDSDEHWQTTILAKIGFLIDRVAIDCEICRAHFDFRSRSLPGDGVDSDDVCVACICLQAIFSVPCTCRVPRGIHFTRRQPHDYSLFFSLRIRCKADF